MVRSKTLYYIEKLFKIIKNMPNKILRNDAKKHMHKNSLIFALLITCLISVPLIVYTTSTFPIFQRTISNSGSIVNSLTLGIYSDENCSTLLSAISWGVCEPGSNKTKIMYIRNEGTTNITFIVEASNWDPSNASLYLTLTSKSERYSIAPMEVTALTLILTISPEIRINTFTFDINITCHS